MSNKKQLKEIFEFFPDAQWITKDKINKAVENISHIISSLDMMLENDTNRPNYQCLKWYHQLLNESKSLLQSDNETTNTRKQLQEACANAYQRGVDNRPYIERFDEYLKSDKEWE